MRRSFHRVVLTRQMRDGIKGMKLPLLALLRNSGLALQTLVAIEQILGMLEPLLLYDKHLEQACLSLYCYMLCYDMLCNDIIC